MSMTAIKVTSSEIDQAWGALTKPKIVSYPLSERQALDMADSGWVTPHEISEVLSQLDRRLDYTWLSRLPDITERLGLQAAHNYPRKWKYADEIVGWSSLSSSDALRYLWWLERLGFPLDLGPLAEAIAETLPRTRNLSESHLDVLLYLAERYSQPPIALKIEHGEHLEVHRTERYTSENGVIAEICYTEDGRAISLTSMAPAYSPPKEQIGTTCEVCGLSYMQGLKGDEDHHTIRHRGFAEPLKPRPSRAWRAAVNDDPEAIWVDKTSPRWMHIAMYRRARAFKREFGYDFVQWSEYPDGNEGGVGYAFLDDEFRMIGGCRFQIGGGVGGRNRLSWIWFCPDARRQGHLSKAWARLQAKMGDFDLEPPVSDAMQAFIRSQRSSES